MNLSYYFESVFSLILLWLPAILGLSILTGFTGLFSFGHAGFIAIGAYSSAIATKVWHLPFAVGILLGCLLAAGVSFLLGRLTLKLKGDYFCLATIGFGETIRQIISNFDWIGGSRGLQLIPKETTLLNVIVINIVLITAVANLIASRHGRNLVAVREEELAAQMAGINVFRAKMTALMLSAALAAVSGALFAHSNQAIQPKDFAMERSTELTIIVILGGVGSLSGSVVGAILLLTLPELFRDFQVWRLAIYGAVVVLIMIARPAGLMGGLELSPKGMRKFLVQRRQKQGETSVNILEVDNVTKCFGGLTAVSNLSFNVKSGGIVGLIGPNGAGKTTLFNLVTGVYKPTSGAIRLAGKNIAGMEPYRIAALGVTRTFQNIRLFKNLNVLDNVLTACHMSAKYTLLEACFRLPFLSSPRFRREEKALKEKAEMLLDIMGLMDRRDLIANNLPYGLQRRLEIVRALALDPRLLLLDEPAAGMNPDETEKLMRFISTIRDQFKLSVVVIEHHMDLIMGVCEQVVVLNFGNWLAEGAPSEIAQNPKVIEAYLGQQGDS